MNAGANAPCLQRRTVAVSLYNCRHLVINLQPAVAERRKQNFATRMRYSHFDTQQINVQRIDHTNVW